LHDGTKEGDGLMQARFEQKRARLNAKVAAKAGTPTSSITN
jgi:hypothetical protein